MFEFDEIGKWSEIKLDIISDYAKAYSAIFAAEQQARLFKYVYIDAFCGAGIHITKTTREPVPGSPLVALQIDPPFHEYHLIDLDGEKIEHLRTLVGGRQGVFIYQGDCNDVIANQVYPRVQFKDYRRGLCLLDPYGLHLNWELIRGAGQLRTIDLFLNFPISDMNRNVIWHNPQKVDARDIGRMNRFWGDDSWRTVAYEQVQTLFGSEDVKTTNEVVAEAFQQRLKDVAGFKYVPDPLPMKNDQGSTVYYLYFASQNEAGSKIARHIFKKYR